MTMFLVMCDTNMSHLGLQQCVEDNDASMEICNYKNLVACHTNGIIFDGRRTFILKKKLLMIFSSCLLQSRTPQNPLDII